MAGHHNAHDAHAGHHGEGNETVKVGIFFICVTAIIVLLAALN